MAEKTEDASSRKIDKAREKGDVPKAKDLTSAISFTVAYYVLLSRLPNILQELENLYILSFAMTDQIKYMHIHDEVYAQICVALVKKSLFSIVKITFPIIIAAGVAATLSGAMISGMVFTFEPLGFSFSKFDVISNIQGKFSKEALINIGKQFFIAIVVSYIMYQTVSSDDIKKRVIMSFMFDITFVAYNVIYVIKELVKKMITALIIISLIDAIYQNRSYYNKLKMDKQEVKDEYKESEGNPETKGKRQEFAKELVYSDGPVGAAKNSTLVVTNPTHIAIAIFYDVVTAPVPIITGKGEDEVASRMISAASDNNVRIEHNPELAWKLIETKVGNSAPVETFQALANILKTISGIKEKVMAVKKH